MIVPKVRDAKKMRVLIGQTGNSQRAFSCKLGISEMHLSRILNENSTPSVMLANKIATALGKEVTDLFEIKVRETAKRIRR